MWQILLKYSNKAVILWKHSTLTGEITKIDIITA